MYERENRFNHFVCLLSLLSVDWHIADTCNVLMTVGITHCWHMQWSDDMLVLLIADTYNVLMTRWHYLLLTHTMYSWHVGITHCWHMQYSDDMLALLIVDTCNIVMTFDITHCWHMRCTVDTVDECSVPTGVTESEQIGCVVITRIV